MPSRNFMSLRHTAYTGLGLITLGVFFLISRSNYLLFHVLVELFSVVVAFSIFTIAWNSQRFLENGYLRFIGVACFYAGILDLLHTLAYKGMGVFPEVGANLATQLWVAARILQGATFLLAPYFLNRQASVQKIFLGFAFPVTLLLVSIFVWKNFPAAYIEGVGLTPFKIATEYILSFAYLGAILFLFRNRNHFEPGTQRLLVLAILASIGTELAFSGYTDVYGVVNAMGHLFKILAFFLLYKAIVQTGFEQPYNLLFWDLKQSQAALQHAHSGLEQRVQERTLELQQTNLQLSAANLDLQSEISERRLAQAKLEQTERALQEQRLLLEMVLKQAADAIVVCDPKGQPLYVNAAARRLAQAAEDLTPRLIPLDWGATYDSEGNFIPVETWPLMQALQGKTTVGREMHVVRADGSSYDILLSAAPLINEGNLLGAVAVFANITSRKQSELALRKAKDELEAKVAERTVELKSANAELASANERLAQTNEELFAANKSLGSANASLNDINEQLELAISGSRAGIWDVYLDPERPGEIPDEIYLSPQMKSFIGFEEGDFPNSRAAWYNQISSDDLGKIQKANQEYLGGKIPDYQVSYRIRHRDGSLRFIESRGKLQRDSLGRAVRWTGIDWDVTDQKRLEAELERLKWLITKSVTLQSLEHPQVSFTPQPYGNLVALNTHRKLLDAVGEEVLSDIISDYLNLLDTSAVVYEENGDYALGIFSSNWCRFLDQASRKLCETDDNFKALHSGRWLCHESCWNKASRISIEAGRPVDVECTGGLRIFAVPISAGGKWIGSINVSYGDPPKEPQKLTEIASLYGLQTKELESLAETYETRPGFIIDVAKNRLFVSARLIGALVDRKWSADALLNSQEILQATVAELQNFAFIASHDLQEPLRKIIAFGDRLEKRYGKEMEGDGLIYLERMQDAAQRMQKMITSLLAYSRVTTQAMPFVKIDLQQLVDEVVNDLEVRIEQSDGKVEWSELPVVEADPLQMRQLLQNLIANALKFHRPGVPPVVVVRAIGISSGMIQLTVEDNGIGFQEQYADRIFLPFERLHGRGEFEGTGIGLAICKKIVDRHGGSIVAHSIPGQGSTFSVTLPAKH